MTEPTTPEEARQKLKELHREKMMVNLKVKKAKERLIPIANKTIGHEAKPQRPQILSRELTLEQACDLLDVTAKTLRRKLAAGLVDDLHPYTLGKLLGSQALSLSPASERRDQYEKFKKAKKEWDDYQKEELEIMAKKLLGKTI